MKECWEPVVNNFRYEVSNLGHVRRIYTRGGKPCCVYKHFTIGRNGYLSVGMNSGSRKLRRVVSVHVLVAQAFLGPRPSGKQVNHKNGIKTDNRSENLEYVTGTENVAHAISTGLFPVGDKHWTRRNPESVLRGSQNGAAVLNEVSVKQIRKLFDAGANKSYLARKFRVGRTTIRNVIDRTRWAHVGAE